MVNLSQTHIMLIISYLCLCLGGVVLQDRPEFKRSVWLINGETEIGFVFFFIDRM